MSANKNKKIVMNFFEAMDKRDTEEVLDFLTEDATWWIIGNLPGVSGMHDKKQLSVLLKYMLPAIGDAPKMSVVHVIAERNYVAAETHTMGKTPKGVEYDNRYHFKFEIKDGKIRKVRAYNDTALIKEVILSK